MIVTIDGPGGSGKSTAARQLATRLQFEFLDTGAMYRGVAWYCLNNRVDLHNSTALEQAINTLELSFDITGELHCNGNNISGLIRTSEVTAAASIVALNSHVREQLVTMQRKIAEGKKIVSEGRDQGTVVFPDAECKFFLTASLEARAARRLQEMQSQGISIDREEIVSQLKERDTRDQNRSIAPLQPAEDATTIDTSQMTISMVIDQLEAYIIAQNRS